MGLPVDAVNHHITFPQDVANEDEDKKNFTELPVECILCKGIMGWQNSADSNRQR